MTAATLIWRNLGRNRARTILTVVSLAVSLFLYTLLAATVDSINAVAADSAQRLRLVAHHKTTMTQLLPLGHQRQIESLPHVRAVCAMRWFGGHVPGNPTEFPTLALDADTLTTVFEDFTITPDVHATWLAERNAAILPPIIVAGRE